MTSALASIDLRSLEPATRLAQLFRAFDALSPSDSFVLTSDQDPKAFLFDFQAKRPASFEWNVLESGPESWRVEIRRRPSAGSRTVDEYLSTDHDRLDALLATVERNAEGGDFYDAGLRFGEFALGLDRHLGVEEALLFPLFEPEAPDGIQEMKAQHASIRALLADIRSALSAEDTFGFLGATGDLRALLQSHHAKEEELVYPMTARKVGELERDSLVQRMQAL